MHEVVERTDPREECSPGSAEWPCDPRPRGPTLWLFLPRKTLQMPCPMLCVCVSGGQWWWGLYVRTRITCPFVGLAHGSRKDSGNGSCCITIHI